MEKKIYLDYAATTPVAPSVIDAMNQCLGITDNFGNPASTSHIWGHNAREAVENARLQVADLLNAKPNEIIWTSGATEANNLAIKGGVASAVKHGKHIITSAIEHAAVLDCFGYLEKSGYDVTYLQPNSHGLITFEEVSEKLRDDTILVSLMHVNNELGTITDIEKIGKITRERGVLFHVDAVQSVARLKIDVRKYNVDLLSLSGHKMYAPKGIGALFVCRDPRIRIEPQIHGGGHEQGFRSGTLPTHQIVGLGVAAQILIDSLHDDQKHIGDLTKNTIDTINEWNRVSINGDLNNRVSGLLNIAIEGVTSAALMTHLPHIAFSSGSACTSADIKPSHVLLALGFNEEKADSSIRISFGRFTTKKTLIKALKDIDDAINDLRAF